MNPRALLLASVAALGACTGDEPAWSVSPSRGGLAGGTAVHIAGDDLAAHGPIVVYFGGRAAKAIVIESRWLVTAVTPQSDIVGDVDVQLVFGDGTTQDLPQAFAYEEQSGIVLQPPAQARSN